MARKNRKSLVGIGATAIALLICLAILSPDNSPATETSSTETSQSISANDSSSSQETTLPSSAEPENSPKKASQSATDNGKSNSSPLAVGEAEEFDISMVAAYSGKPYVAINNNQPFFSEEDVTTTSYETLSPLDPLGRCGTTVAVIGQDIMPTEERGNIGQVKPTGWHTIKYDWVDGKYLYNRCHLNGYQLTGNNAEPRNLITGTRYMNVDGMLPFENMVADYVKETDNHVLYRVTPVFEGTNLLATGVLMEALSCEDLGDDIEFCVFCYNVQPGVTIDYATGDSYSDGTMEVSTTQKTAKQEPVKQEQTTQQSGSSTSSTSSGSSATLVWIPTHGGTKYHSRPGCSGMVDPEQVTQSEAEARGFTPCKKCH